MIPRRKENSVKIERCIKRFVLLDFTKRFDAPYILYKILT